jgi:hypothetical protein
MHLGGATVLRGHIGFGHSSRIHTTKILRLSEDLPVVVEIVDSQEKIDIFLPVLDGMMSIGLITMERAGSSPIRQRERESETSVVSIRKEKSAKRGLLVSSAWASFVAQELENARMRSELLSLGTVTARLVAWTGWNRGPLQKIPTPSVWSQLPIWSEESWSGAFSQTTRSPTVVALGVELRAECRETSNDAVPRAG